MRAAQYERWMNLQLQNDECTKRYFNAGYRNTFRLQMIDILNFSMNEYFVNRKSSKLQKEKVKFPSYSQHNDISYV